MKKLIIFLSVSFLLVGCASPALPPAASPTLEQTDSTSTPLPTSVPMLPASVPPLVGLDSAFQTPGDFSAYADKLFSQSIADANGNGFEDEVNAMFAQNGLSLEYQSNKDFAASVVQACKTINGHTFKDRNGNPFAMTGIEFAIGNGQWLVAVRTAQGVLTVDGGLGYPVEFTDGKLTDIVDRDYSVVPGSENMMVAVDEAGKMKLVERVVEEAKPILVGFDPKMNELMAAMAEANITYKPLMNEQGTELKQGIVYREDAGSGEFIYISGTVMGLLDLEKAFPGEFANSHAVVIEVEREDGKKILFPIEFWRGSGKSSMKTTTAYLQGPVNEGFIGTNFQIERTSFDERYDYFVQKFPSMIGQQIIVSLPRSYDPTSEQYKAVQKILDAINGVNSDDVKVGYENMAERFPDDPTFTIPDDGTRP